MTLPDKLTFSRLLSAPLVFIIWYLAFYHGIQPKIGTFMIWFLFLTSEISDVLDGSIARRQGIVSDLGKLMDPFCDVFLRITYFTCFLASGLMPVWTLAIIIWREMGINFIRMLLIRQGIALAANFFGKIKSTLYFISGVGGLFCLTLRAWGPDIEWRPMAERIAEMVFIGAALAALLSFLVYLRSYFRSGAHKIFSSDYQKNDSET